MKHTHTCVFLHRPSLLNILIAETKHYSSKAVCILDAPPPSVSQHPIISQIRRYHYNLSVLYAGLLLLSYQLPWLPGLIRFPWQPCPSHCVRSCRGILWARPKAAPSPPHTHTHRFSASQGGRAGHENGVPPHTHTHTHLILVCQT